jgi:small subunit ribosomal protein S16
MAVPLRNETTPVCIDKNFILSEVEMVRIRLQRAGKKHEPTYRIVVADSRAPRDGKFVEIIGHYNPRTEPETMVVDEARALHWLRVGAQPTEAVRTLLRKTGTLARFERLKAGEPLEALVAEATALEAGASTSPR